MLCFLVDFDVWLPKIRNEIPEYQNIHNCIELDIQQLTCLKECNFKQIEYVLSAPFGGFGDFELLLKLVSISS